jgi:hypothetical protein
MCRRRGQKLSFNAFFGYGSLVNRATHTHTLAVPARLRGWRRIWRHGFARNLAYLSAAPDPDGEIAGLIAAVTANEWADLDQREAAYRRLPLDQENLSPMPDWAAKVHVYSIDAAPKASQRQPILLSYLDVVLQGYLREFGPEGPADFCASTSDWGPILDDRSAPLYPRHQRLGRSELGLVDDHISALGLVLIRA